MRFTLFVGMAFASGTAPVLAQGGFKAALPPDTVIRAQENLRFLGFELTLLERDILPTLRDAASRGELAAHLTRAQSGVAALERNLDTTGGAAFVRKRYIELDKDLHRLIDAIELSPAASLALHQSGKRLAFADAQLSSIFSRGDGADDLFPVVVRRQAFALEQAAGDLDELIKVAAPVGGRGAFLRDASRKFKQAAAIFADRLDVDDPFNTIRAQYIPVDRAWQRLAAEVNHVPEPAAHRLLLAAKNCDHLHERLCGLLKIDSGDYLLKETDERIRQAVTLLQGAWYVNSIHQNGKAISGARPERRLIFAGTRWFREDDRVVVDGGTFRVVELSPTDAKLELTATSGKAKGRLTRVLIRMEGSLLRFAHFSGRPGYPTGYVTAPGDDMVSYTWRRAD